MYKILTKENLSFLVKSAFVIGFILALADLLTLLLYGEKTTVLLTSIKLIVVDFGLSSLSMLLIAPIFLLISKLHSTSGRFFVYIVAFLLLLSGSLLNKYYATTHLSLGSDLYGYSLSDIKMIINTSSDISLTSFWPIVVLVGLLIGMFKLLKINNKQTIGLAAFLLLSVAFFTINSLAQKPTQSNLSFFVKDSFEYLQNNKSSKTNNWDESNPFPLLRDNDQTEDLFGKYLNLKAEKPNIVMIVVEGLGRDFTGENAEYPGFTPFLDSLANKSLYWTNFVSNAGRSFGALPSILGSLPFGKNGFLDLENLPEHISLINQLKKSNYKTAYFEGGDADFDRKLKYLNHEGMESIVDANNYGSEYKKAPSKDGFSWGYPDAEIFKKALNDIKPIAQPRFDLILTISNHEPFVFNDKEKFLAQADMMLSKSTLASNKKNILNKYKDIVAALLYTDASIKEFMEKYKTHPNYDNTIFVITGDHRLIPIPQKDEICRYHVPLIVHSPMLTKPEKFLGISSHMDIMPTILAMINNKYGEKNIEKVPWIGTGLSGALSFANEKNIPLSRHKGAVKDFISGSKFLSDKTLYEINEKFEISEISNDDEYNNIENKLVKFQEINNYVTQNNKIIPPNLVEKKTNVQSFTKEQLGIIDRYLKPKSEEDPFMVAREIAFKKQYDDALLLCNYIIKDSPNHFDCRTLKGRIYAWSGDFENAENELKAIIDRSPRYKDAYSAILDLYWWNDKPEKAKELAKKAKENINDDTEFQKTISTAMKRFDKSI
ncbi:MAG TPA: sulfatase-like hydrolase/transferase [Leadbetterella sp.]|nr:sulfatase-like hydrolase/transferase [Leadbetterella sp.]